MIILIALMGVGIALWIALALAILRLTLMDKSEGGTH